MVLFGLADIKKSTKKHKKDSVLIFFIGKYKNFYKSTNKFLKIMV